MVTPDAVHGTSSQVYSQATRQYMATWKIMPSSFSSDFWKLNYKNPGQRLVDFFLVCISCMLVRQFDGCINNVAEEYDEESELTILAQKYIQIERNDHRFSFYNYEICEKHWKKIVKWFFLIQRKATKLPSRNAY
ncbi:Consortin [Dirofilaria immitis]